MKTNPKSLKAAHIKLVPILYKDDQYVVFDKPAGLLVIPTPQKEQRTLESIVNGYDIDKKEAKLYPCHRLDRDTSGAIIFAWGKNNQRRMMDLFKNRSVKKIYLAIAHGILKKKSDQIKAVIKDFDAQKYHSKSKGRFAQTDYRVIGQGKEFSFLEVFPRTGRTNQIRIHLSQIGHPLVGERKYAFAKDYLLKFRRTALHAHILECQNPITGKMIKAKAPLPEDMEKFLLNYDYQGV
ncbi:MAG: RNA pseudouridine synthase [Candidatus Omnitrophica bacterium]|nr:RNA pseudouridine synthase [Candidatus Omnitrophota bacterium]